MTNNGFLMGSSIISTPNVVPHSYTGFKFNGNCTIDSICIKNKIQTDSEILQNSIAVGVEPDWTPEVIFLSSMNQNVDGSNVVGLVDSAIGWELYRREVNGSVMYKVCDVDMTVQSWIDYKVEGGGKEYEYILFAKSATQISGEIVTEKIKPNFWAYYLIDAVDVDNRTNNDSVECYMFDVNLTSNKNIVNSDVTEMKGYGKYSTFIFGDRDYISGDFQTMLIPQINGVYDFEGITRWQDYLEKLHTFICNKKPKYYKNRAGQMLKVLTSANSGSGFDFKYEDNIYVNGNQPITVTISYVQIDENENSN